MGLRSKLDSKLLGAWGKLDDIVIYGCTLKHVTASSYDVATSEAGTTSADETVDVVLTTLTEQQIQELTGGDGQYQALIRLAQITVIPSEGDIIIISGEEYKVVGVDVDPARVLFTGFLAKRGAVSDGLGE